MPEIQKLEQPIKRARSIGPTLDLDEIADLQRRRLVFVNKHPELDLYIANYNKPSKESLWTPTLELARGVIYNSEGTIISRPFARMGDLRQGEVMPNDAYTAFPKIDGSLAIAYPTPEGMRIASRGNFGGDVAEIGSQILHAVRYDFGKDVTPLFELVHPGRKHVVEYGAEKSMRLIGLIENSTGRELALPQPDEVEYPVARALGALSISELLTQDNGNMEGFVLQNLTPTGNEFDRYKLKVPSYYMKDDIKGGWAPYKIWNELRRGSKERINILPEGEIRNDAQQIVDELYDAYDFTIERLLKMPENLLSPRELQALQGIRKKGVTEERDVQAVWELIAPPRRVGKKLEE